MGNFINFDDFDKEIVTDAIKIGLEEKNKLNTNKETILKVNKFLGL